MKKTLFSLCIILIIIALLFTNADIKLYSMNEEIVELTGYRNTYEKVYKHQNGKLEHLIHAFPIHYYDEGEYKEYNYELNETKESSLVTFSNDYNVEFKENSIVKLNYFNDYYIMYNYNKKTGKAIKVDDPLSDEEHYSNNYSAKIMYRNNQELSMMSINPLKLTEETKIVKKDNNYTYSYFLSTNLEIMCGEEISFVNEYNKPIYKVQKPYIKDSNNNIYYSNNIVIEKKQDNEYCITVMFDENIINNNFIFPITTVNATSFVLNPLNDSFCDKYVISGQSGYYDNDYLFTGKDRLLMYTESGQLIYPYYKSFIKLGFSNNLFADDIESVELTAKKSNTANATPIAKKIISSNNNYESLQGTSNYSTTGSVSPVINGTTYKYDVTNFVTSNINNGINFSLIELASTTTSNVLSFFSSSSPTLPMTLSVVYNFDDDSSPYGCAFEYSETSDFNQNCYGYVLDWPQFINISSSEAGNFSVDLTDLIEKIEEKNGTCGGYYTRMISSSDSPIFPYERRIAFRCGNVNNGVFDYFHFLMEHNDGRWSHKLGHGFSELLGVGITPSYAYWRGFLLPGAPQGYYNSEILYFAIS